MVKGVPLWETNKCFSLSPSPQEAMSKFYNNDMLQSTDKDGFCKGWPINKSGVVIQPQINCVVSDAYRGAYVVILIFI